MGDRASKCIVCENEEEEPDLPTSVFLSEDPLQEDRIVLTDITKDFEIKSKILGTGAVGPIRLAKSRTTNQRIALKRIVVTRANAYLVKNEVEVYLQVRHPNICKLLYVYKSEHGVDLGMEVCGIDLQYRLDDQKFYQEAKVVDMMLQMLQAVCYLHGRNIVHRDVKLENWLCSKDDCEDHLKLVDFGFSQCLSGPDETMTHILGTILYVCPEMFLGKYTLKCDTWSLGIICYMLLLGRPPFWVPKNEAKTKEMIVQGEFPKTHRWKLLSDDAHDFIAQLLQKHPAQRPDATGSLQICQKWKSTVQ